MAQVFFGGEPYRVDSPSVSILKKTDALGPLLLFLVAPVVFRVVLRLLALRLLALRLLALRLFCDERSLATVGEAGAACLALGLCGRRWHYTRTSQSALGGGLRFEVHRCRLAVGTVLALA